MIVGIPRNTTAVTTRTVVNRADTGFHRTPLISKAGVGSVSMVAIVSATSHDTCGSAVPAGGGSSESSSGGTRQHHSANKPAAIISTEANMAPPADHA